MFRCSVEFKSLALKVATKYNLSVTDVINKIIMRIKRNTLKTCHTILENKMYDKSERIAIRNFKNPCDTIENFIELATAELNYELNLQSKTTKINIFKEIEGVDYIIVESI